MGCRHSVPLEEERRESLPDLQQFTLEDLNANWIQYRNSLPRPRRGNSRTGFLRAVSETVPSTDLTFEQFQVFANKTFCNDEAFKMRLLEAFDFEETSMVTYRDAALCVVMLEKFPPADKLKNIFEIFDDDRDGKLPLSELHVVVEDVSSIAGSLGCDSAALYNKDANEVHTISLADWVKLGMDCEALKSFVSLDITTFRSARLKDSHEYRLKAFSHQTFCNVCQQSVQGIVRRALLCNLCGHVSHLRCQTNTLGGCRVTSVDEAAQGTVPQHFWVDGNVSGKCAVCHGRLRSRSPDESTKCAWCHAVVHSKKCRTEHTTECDLGPLRDSVLPAVSMVEPRRTREGGEERINIRPLFGSHPVCVFVNSRSGAGQGLRVLRQFRYYLNPRQVFDLAQGGPAEGLNFFRDVPNFRVVCGGGDGTVGWVLSVLDKMDIKQRPPLAVLPLGTGNDLSRCLGWGGGFEGESVQKLLLEYKTASIVNLDRWNLTFTEAAESDPIPLTILNNYFSIGVDASIALRFHQERESNPRKFTSRAKNKVFYAQYGAAEAFRSSCANLDQQLELEVDGKPVTLPVIQGLIFINITSMYGGSNLWGTHMRQPFHLQDIGDGKIEVVAIFGSAHVGQIKGGLRNSAKRIAQGSHVKLKTLSRLPMQTDGEPWSQSACTIEITLASQQPMLKRLTFVCSASAHSVTSPYSASAPTSSVSIPAPLDEVAEDPASLAAVEAATAELNTTTFQLPPRRFST